MKSAMLRGLLAALIVACSNICLPASVPAEPAHPEQQLRQSSPTPYIVKKGDTLWDIANHFFKDPKQWLRIWEHNLYITNPDLIYPGNEIRFDATQQQQGGLRIVYAKPAVLIKPVQRLEPPIDNRLVLHALERFDFISNNEIQGDGYILDASDDRLNYGANDRIYVRLNANVRQIRRFDVFRSTDPITDPRTGEIIGMLVNHRGQIELTDDADTDIRHAVVRKAFKEISPGDRLKPARQLNTSITPITPDRDYAGVVLYIRDDAAEAGQNQVIGITPNTGDGIKPGMRLTISRQGRTITDPLRDTPVTLPEEIIGEALVLVTQQAGSIALVTRSTRSINIGDIVHSKMK